MYHHQSLVMVDVRVTGWYITFLWHQDASGLLKAGGGPQNGHERLEISMITSISWSVQALCMRPENPSGDVALRGFTLRKADLVIFVTSGISHALTF